jgi:hypothetical protein
VATNFPTALDALRANQVLTDGASVITAAPHNNLMDAVDALQAKVGSSGSAVATSHDYLLANHQVFPAMVTGNTDINAPAAEADMTGMVLSLTTKGTQLYISFVGPFTGTGNQATADLYIYVDAAKVRTTNVRVYQAGYGHHQCLNCLATGLTPGAHTVKVRWKAVVGVMVQNGAGLGVRTLIAHDIP